MIFIRWFSEILNFNVLNSFDKLVLLLLVVFFILFLLFAYKNNFKTLFIIFIGIALFSWPGIVAYPNPRYINAVYPFLIFIFVYGIYLFSEQQINKYIKSIVLILCFSLILLSIYFGIKKNTSGILGNARNSLVYKLKFQEFFDENKFNKDVNFIVFGVPFVSDIQNVFQIFLNNLDLKVAFIKASTLAEFGQMGCRADCKIIGVQSNILPVKKNEKIGFRLTSLDEEHCGWWMNFSHFPLKWSEGDRAYIWTSHEPEIGEWHKYSMGEFKIHKRMPQKQITDVTFLIDKKWINQNTVFVTWDSILGRYKIIKLF